MALNPAVGTGRVEPTDAGQVRAIQVRVAKVPAAKVTELHVIRLPTPTQVQAILTFEPSWVGRAEPLSCGGG